MAQIKLLTARHLNSLQVGFHSDGGNLYLRVRESGSRAWVFRYKLAGRLSSGGKTKANEIGLGPVSDRSLLQARELAARMRTALADGKNPADLVRVQRDPQKLTFKACAEGLIESKQVGWRNAKHAQQWTNTLMQYAYPTLGNKNPAEISLADVKAILLPIWATKTETATRVRQRIEAVLDYAAVHEGAHERNNPARWRGVLDKVLPPARKVTRIEHHAAAPFAEVPAIMSALREKDTLSAHCLRFIILTAARSGEARGAQWSEIDLENRTWTIPAARMKAGRVHRVPLNAEAMQILEAMKSRKLEKSDSVFPGERGGLLSDVAVNKTLHIIAPEVTCHGFRSSFRVWGAETTAHPSAVLETALAHVNKDKVEEAYQRSDLFERRVELMTAWGRFCDNSGKVLQLVKAA